MHFGGIDDKFADYETARFVVIPVPYDLTSTYQAGSRKGPQAILEASCNMELFDEELCTETFRAGIHTMSPLEVAASGPETMIGKVEKVVADICADDKVPVTLGGEHSISIGAIAAVHAWYPDLTVVHLDAHADMRDSYQGTRYGHASVARRVSEMCPVIEIGIRSMSYEEDCFIREQGVYVVSADEMKTDSECIEKICASLSSDVYVSIDLDVFDPAVMPATGTPEPGGLTWDDVRKVTKAIARTARIRGFDIVELCPLPGIVAPDFTAAKLVYRMIGYCELHDNGYREVEK